MACGLKDDELEVLNALYRHHCFNDKASYNLKQIAQAFRRKFGRDPRDVAKDLEKMGYIKSKPKKDMKYWIDDMGLACYALNQHGYNAIDGRVPQGRINHL